MVIPTSLRELVLKQLHSSHMGIVKTKCWARSYVWWPGVDRDVEELCRACDTCALEAEAPPRAPPRPWPYLPHPWSRLHMDFLGPIQGKTFFVMVDSTSKWLEIYEMKSTNAAAVIKVLRTTFARFGLPTEIVSDQGPPFTSSELRAFLDNNGIRQTFSPVYHPASNGAAENAVKLCKRAIKKALRDKLDLDTALQSFLLVYRNTVHSTTGETPAMLLQKRKLRTRMDLLRNDFALENKVQNAQEVQTKNAGGVERDFILGDAVWSRGYGSNDKWVKGTVVDKEGSRKYVLDNGNGQFHKRHVDQVRRRSRWSNVADTNPSVTSDPSAGTETAASGGGDAVPPGTAMVEERASKPNIHLNEPPSNLVVEASKTQTLETSTSYTPPQSAPEPQPRRERKPVTRYGFEFD